MKLSDLLNFITRRSATLVQKCTNGAKIRQPQTSCEKIFPLSFFPSSRRHYSGRIIYPRNRVGKDFGVTAFHAPESGA